MSDASAISFARAAIEQQIYQGLLLLDRREFSAWLELTTADFRYRITAYSPEIRKEMTWLEHDRRGLAALIQLLPKHHVDGAAWFRHGVVYSVEHDAIDRVRTVTSFAAYHTLVDIGDIHQDSGSSRLFAVGRYHDRLRREGEHWLLEERTVRLETRQLGIGSHVFV